MISTKTLLAAAVSGCLLFPVGAAASEGDYVLSDYTLFDEASCFMKINSVTVDEFWGLMLNVTCENRTTDHSMMFCVENSSVEGYMADPYWSYELEASASGESSMAFNLLELEKYGITSVDEISFDLVVYDSENFAVDPFYRGSFTIYPTGLSEGNVEYPVYVPAEGSQTLVQNDQLSFIYENSEVDDFWGYTLNVYLENKTDLSLMYSLDDVKINGIDCDPFWATAIPPMKKEWSQIAFSALEDSGITGEVTDISFRLTVYDSNDWSADPLVDETFSFQP